MCRDTRFTRFSSFGCLWTENNFRFSVTLSYSSVQCTQHIPPYWVNYVFRPTPSTRTESCSSRCCLCRVFASAESRAAKNTHLHIGYWNTKVQFFNEYADPHIFIFALVIFSYFENIKVIHFNNVPVSIVACIREFAGSCSFCIDLPMSTQL